MASLLPIFLDLKEKNVLLLGGGRVALEKLEKLILTGAQIEVIAREIHPDTERLLQQHGIQRHLRSWESDDLSSRFLVISALNDPAEHARVAQEARALKVLINAVDEPRSSDFYFAAQMERGPLQLAISTHGLFPGVARAIRIWLEEFLPHEITPEFDHLVQLRSSVRNHIPDTVQRMQALREQLQIWLQQGAPRGEHS